MLRMEVEIRLGNVQLGDEGRERQEDGRHRK